MQVQARHCRLARQKPTEPKNTSPSVGYVLKLGLRPLDKNCCRDSKEFQAQANRLIAETTAEHWKSQNQEQAVHHFSAMITTDQATHQRWEMVRQNQRPSWATDASYCILTLDF
ncbi:hypothetical protein PoB_001386000 [Plakobranchus ocellatus]|uniref:Uncharacterized protein n=1 Tax=Plakobranchus ocellatus TaxID=259542 RepID=A0AAV3YY48_9GAST|nr:hypothetical protein PoB_001386000 [Plakobranchus ocellatus]